MTINLSDNSPRISYTVSQGATQTTFAVPFEFFDDADLNVYVDGTLKTITTHYTVSGGSGSTGSVGISVTGISGGSTVIITRNIALARTTDFPTSGPFDVATLNTELDRFTAQLADQKDQNDRSVSLADDDAAASMTLPLKASRVGTVLGFNATTGAAEAGPKIANVNSLSAITADIAALADIEDGTTATDAISGLAAIKTDVTAVANIATAVSAVNSNSTNINAVNSNSSNINTVAGSISNVNAVGAKASLITSDFISDLNTLAVTDVINDINTLATSDIVNDLNTLATSDIVSDLNTLATSDIVSDINTLATSDIVTDLNLLATSDFVSDLNTVATSGNVTAVNNVSGAIANVNTVANNLTTVNTFGTQYQVSANAPSNPTEGLLWFDTTNDIMKVYEGSGFVNAGSSVNGTAARYSYTATASQTSFAATYDAGYVDVYLNGVKLVSGTDFTATNGSTVVLAIGAALNDTVDIIGYGTFSVSSAVTLPDNVKATFGTGSDMEIYHDGSNSFVAGNNAGNNTVVIKPGGTGSVLITNSAGDNIITQQGDAAHLHYDNFTKLATTATGVDVTGVITTDGMTTSADINFGDNDKAVFGAGSDLQIYHDGSNSYINEAGTGDLYIRTSNEIRIQDGNQSNFLYAVEGADLRLYHNGSEKLRTESTGVTMTGKVGIGTASPTDYDAESNNLVVASSGHTGVTIASTGSNQRTNLYFADGTSGTSTYIGGFTYNHSDNSLLIRTNGAEAMRIDSAGIISKNGTFSYSGTSDNFYWNVGSGDRFRFHSGVTASRDILGFSNPNGGIGAINTNGTTTSFVTSSDYRLKTAVEYDWNATTRLKQLKPARFKWIADGDDAVFVDGFLAHEAATVCPESVTGTKDAMRDEAYEISAEEKDADGNVTKEAVMGTRSVIDPQGIDQAKLVPLLCKTILELEARITALEAG